MHDSKSAPHFLISVFFKEETRFTFESGVDDEELTMMPVVFEVVVADRQGRQFRTVDTIDFTEQDPSFDVEEMVQRI